MPEGSRAEVQRPALPNFGSAAATSRLLLVHEDDHDMLAREHATLHVFKRERPPLRAEWGRAERAPVSTGVTDRTYM